MNSEVTRAEGETDVGEAAIVMAVGIVVDRISRIAEADRRDLYELVKALRETSSPEELASIRQTMVEILDQEPVKVQRFDLDAPPKGEKLKKWAKYVGDKIKALRESKDMTQADLAAESGLPQSHISRIEKAQHSPSRATIEKVAKGLGVKVKEIDPVAE